MGHKKDNDILRTIRQHDRLNWEFSKELGIEGNPEKGIPGGLKEKVKTQELLLAREGKRKAEANLNDDL